jgi:DNA-binding Xre family transcriptional regulator
MDAHHKRTGERMTYQKLAAASGLSIATLQSLAVRSSYNTTISTIERLCIALDCTPGDLLILSEAKDACVK